MQQLNRRQLLGQVGATAMVALGGPETWAAARPRASLIDVHRHIVSPRLRTLGEPQGLSLGPLATMTVEKVLADMEAGGVARSILTQMTPPSSFRPTTVQLGEIARDANEMMARMVSDRPQHFGFFAELPMPDIDASIRELGHALDTLKADGVQLHTSYGNQWLGDPAFAPLFAELNRHKAIVYTHPLEAACCKPNVPDIAATVIEFAADTSRTIASFLFSGSAARYPDVRMIFSHGGGVLAGIAGRFSFQAAQPAMKDRLPNGLEHELRRFYYDTAQAFHPATMRGLKAAVPSSQLLFGTDYPFRSSTETWAGVLASKAFSRAELRAIASGNAQRLLATR